MGPIAWPNGYSFAFTIFDDPDSQTEAQSRALYGLLADLGLRTTKGIWAIDTGRKRNSAGETCASTSFRQHCVELQDLGFELGYHNAAPHDCHRAETAVALARFQEYFGADPQSMANHYNAEAIYWGPARLSGLQRVLYQAATLGRTTNRFFGHLPDNPHFWGDLCREHLRYCRNFVLRDINTLAACPWMPYHDPERPYVNRWFASTEGAQGPAFMRAIDEASQDRLEAEGGACIMYTHFGLGFFTGDRIQPRVVDLLTRLSRKKGWFVPVATLLDYLGERNPSGMISRWDRNALERRWLAQQLRRGTGRA